MQIGAHVISVALPAVVINVYETHEEGGELKMHAVAVIGDTEVWQRDMPYRVASWEAGHDAVEQFARDLAKVLAS